MIKKNQYTVINFGLVSFFIGCSLFFFIFLPIFFKDTNWLFLLLVWALFSNPLWVLIHEGIHFVLFKNKKINLYFSRVLSVLFGSPFRILQIGHLLHHSFNRTRDEVTDLYNPKNTNTFKAYIKYYFWILFGLYAFEIFSNFLVFIPDSLLKKIERNYSFNKLLRNFIYMFRIHKKEIFIDSVIIIFFYSTVFFIYSEKWFIVLFFLLIRGFLISTMDNVYHYGTKENQILFGYDLKMPSFLELFLLFSNHHGFHHKKSRVPWYENKSQFLKRGYSYHGNFFRQFLKQFRGPIKNFNI